MKIHIFHIIKILISMVLQYYMLLTCPMTISMSDYRSIFFDVITLLSILLGEWGVYLLFTLQPKENEKYNKIYAKAYIGINVIFFGMLMYEYFTRDFIGAIIWGF